MSTHGAARLALGTVQFGLDYGISNQQGQTPPAEIDRILTLAHGAGVTVLDTAALYGDAESAIGASAPSADFAVVTKTPHFTDEEALVATFHRSLRRLQRERVYGLLVHRPADLLDAHADRVWSTMVALRERGLVQKLGVSVYELAELDAITTRYDVELVQLPCNVFDPTMVDAITALQAAGVEVHVRSLFLQGLAFMDPATLPPYFEPVRPTLERWHAEIARAQATPLRAALSFGLALRAEKLVVGVENAQQLREILDAIAQPVSLEWSSFALGDARFTAPKNWVLG